ncbi:hypothetical protein HBB16_08665 [Pseudonocardia sp. MCCB 268]|nr:hypothetical protein [Pseudonocardia cytotoxica]
MQVAGPARGSAATTVVVDGRAGNGVDPRPCVGPSAVIEHSARPSGSLHLAAV